MAIVGGGAQAELAVVHERQLMPVPAALGWPGQAACRRCSQRPTTRSSRKASCAAVSDCSCTAERVESAPRRFSSPGGRCARRRHRAPRGVTGGGRCAWRDGHRAQGFAEHGPFDVILELVGSPNLAENLQALGVGGRICVIGVSAGVKAELNLLALMGKRARIHGSTLRARPLEEKALAARLLEREVLPLFEAGELRVPVAETFALDDAAAAYDRFAAGGKFGKIVLTL